LRFNEAFYAAVSKITCTHYYIFYMFILFASIRLAMGTAAPWLA